MSLYSETMGSFVRTSNYPLEANYIFLTENELKSFFEDPLNNVILHEGLLKVVLKDENGNQALYWVTKDDENLKFSKLISFGNIEELQEGLEELNETLLKEIEDRILADSAIWGTSDSTTINPELNSILKLSKAVIELQDYTSTLKDELKSVVGTEQDNIKEYLQTLDYNSLTQVSNKLHYFLDSVDNKKDTIDTWLELQAFLEGFNDKDTLLQILTDLWYNILGDPLPNTPFRTLRGIQDFVEELKSYSINRMNNLQTELDLTLIGVGLSGDGSYNPDKETHYLKDATSVMNALKILDSLINEAINNCNIQSKNTESVEIDIKKEVDKTTILAKVKVSSEDGNDITIKNDGIYHNIDSEYENGILTIKVNGNVRLQHVLGLSSIVKTAYYDTTKESIIIIFKLLNGDELIVDIPAGSLIQEWIIDNSNPTKVVELEKVRVVNGADKLSADVRISTNKYNILEKENNTLLVRGTADNIVYNGDVTTKLKLDSLTSDLNSEITRSTTKDEELTTSISNEISRAKEAEHVLEDSLNAEITRAKNEEKTILDKLFEVADKLNGEIDDSIELLQSDLTSEINRAKEAELVLRNDLNTEIQRSNNLDNRITKNESDISTLNTKVDNEITRAILKENDINSDLDKETTRATKAESDLQTLISNEITRSVGKDEEIVLSISNLKDYVDINFTNDTALKGEVNLIKDNLNQEISRAKTEESRLDSKIDNAKEVLTNNINTEKLRAEAKEDLLQSKIEAEETRAIGIENKLISDLDLEKTRATSQETNLSNTIESESNRAKEAESTLTNNLQAEISRAQIAEQSLVSSIADETTRAKAEEALLKTGINTTDTNVTLANTEIDSLKTKTDTTNTNLTAEINRAKLAELVLSDSIGDETERASNAETLLDTKITNLTTRVATEENRAKTAELTLTTNLNTTNTNLSAEIERAKGREDEIEKTLESSNTNLELTNLNIGKVSDELVDLITKCIVTGKTTASEAYTELSKLGTGYSTVYEIGQTLKSFLVDTDTANSTINKWKEIESFLKGVTDLLTLTKLLSDLETKLTNKINTDITTEKTRAENAEKGIATNTANISNLSTQVSGFEQRLTDEITNRGEADTLLSGRIDSINSGLIGVRSDVNTNTENIGVLTQGMAILSAELDDTVNPTIESILKDLKAEVKRSTEKDTELQTNLTNLNSRVDTVESTANTNKTDITSLKTKTDATNTKLNTVEETANKNKTDIALVKATAESTKTIADKNKEDITSINTNISNIESDINNIKSDVSLNKSDISSLNTSVNSISGLITTLDGKIQLNTNSITSINTKIDNINDSITDINNDIKENSNKITSANTKIVELETRVGAVESDNVDLEKDIKQAQKDISSINTSVTANTGNITNLTTKVTNLETTISTLETDVSEIESKIENIQIKIDPNLNGNIKIRNTSEGLSVYFEWGDSYD